MLQGKNECGLYLSPGKDARLHITRSWQQGKPVEVAAAWGIDPLFMVVGSQTFPKNVSEYEFLGGIKGEPIPVVKGKTTDLLLPANAEFVIEGIIKPNSVQERRTVRRIPRLLRPARSRLPAGGNHRDALSQQSDSHQCSDGRLSIQRAERVFLRSSARRGSGTIWTNSAYRASKAVYAHPAGAGGFGMTVISAGAALCGPRRTSAGVSRASTWRRVLHEMDHCG